MESFRRTIQLIESGPTSSGFLRWYRARFVECGHSCSIGANPWQEPVEKPGDKAICKKCATAEEDVRKEQEMLSTLEALDIQQERIVYARYKKIISSYSYCLYRRDESSPTGVMLHSSYPATPVVDAILRRKGISPLSPTEK